MNNLTDKVKHKAAHSKEKSDLHGEVFTPIELINQMLDSIPKDFWYDKSKTWFDPSAGVGNMPSVIVERLMKTLSDQIEDANDRYKYIMENMIYMAEYQEESAKTIEEIFNPNGNIKLNLYFGDTLKMPTDFFDLSYEERFNKYPQNCIKPTEPTNEKKSNPWIDNLLAKVKGIKKRTESHEDWMSGILAKAKRLRK